MSICSHDVEFAIEIIRIEGFCWLSKFCVCMCVVCMCFCVELNLARVNSNDESAKVIQGWTYHAEIVCLSFFFAATEIVCVVGQVNRVHRAFRGWPHQLCCLSLCAHVLCAVCVCLLLCVVRLRGALRVNIELDFLAVVCSAIKHRSVRGVRLQNAHDKQLFVFVLFYFFLVSFFLYLVSFYFSSGTAASILILYLIVLGLAKCSYSMWWMNWEEETKK